MNTGWHLVGGWPHAVLITGAVVVVVLVVLLIRRVRHVGTDRVVTLAASAVAMSLSAQGTYILLVTRLELPEWEAVLACAVAEMALTAEALRAEASIRRHGHDGGHASMVWGIAIGAGIVVATSAENTPAALVRLVIPPLVAGLWWAGIRENAHRRPEAITWRITPRRLLVMLGLAQPGTSDLVTVDQQRRSRALARLIHRRHVGSKVLRGWRAARLHRLAEDATPALIEAVRSRLDATTQVLTLAGLVETDRSGIDPNGSTARRSGVGVDPIRGGSIGVDPIEGASTRSDPASVDPVRVDRGSTVAPIPGPVGSGRSSRAVGQKPGRRRSDPVASTPRPPRRSVADIEAQVRSAIEAGELGVRPSAEAIRRAVACAPSTARVVRDVLSADVPSAGVPAADVTAVGGVESATTRATRTGPLSTANAVNTVDAAGDESEWGERV